MKVTAGTLLLKLATETSPQEYPVSLAGVRADTGASFAVEPEEELINHFGYVVVDPVAVPTGDVVTEGEPELVEGRYRQTWTTRAYTAEEEAAQLAAKKIELTQQVENLRITKLEAGFPYDFGAEHGTMIVQCRAEDRTNLIASRIDADSFVTAGQGDQLLPFRTFENVIVMMMAADLVTMTNAALAYIRQVYGATWMLKDAIDGATTLAGLPVVPETLTV